ncbi:hypothetical protein OsI_38502 [Oryza sativa Indica Group]|uniref:Uncharacterized protein n=1 Tax=Oryza sativa subsp. indica TaxID=39946 RepID=A2ZL10_ORYSI|nr:hypothetical protein OsI_38502 [Oryza sativa Indica Group]
MAISIPITEMANTIIRLPIYMREGNNKGLFEPRVISIGPYHRGHEISTLNMEAHKEKVLEGFFQRQGNVSREDYIADVKTNCFQQARRCYSGNTDGYTPEMLMLDGCFIIELLLRWNKKEDVHDNYVRVMSNSIYYDLLMVDNQIPFFVLTRIFDKVKRHTNENPDTRLVDLVIDFFNHKGQFSWANLDQLDSSNVCQVRHLLDLQYRLVVGNNTRNNNNEEPMLNNGCPFSLCGNIRHSPRSMPLGIPGANELQDYGVRFNMNKNKQAKMFDVTFKRKTMRIPHFKINFGSKILLANLFAYDQIICHRSNQTTNQPTRNQTTDQPGNNVGPVTSYVVLMNALINDREDVVVLQREGILDNLLSNEEEVASFFNNLGRCTLVDVSKHHYTSMFNDVNKYWKNKLSCCRYFAIFSMKHCKNPWTCLSLLGAILLLLISSTSMIFAILKYARK